MSYGLGAYKKTSVQTASKEQILLMLYQAAIKNCKKAIQAVNEKKQRQIAKAALSYIKQKGIKDTDIRFDVVSIHKNSQENSDIDLIQNAFSVDGYMY